MWFLSLWLHAAVALACPCTSGRETTKPYVFGPAEPITVPAFDHLGSMPTALVPQFDGLGNPENGEYQIRYHRAAGCTHAGGPDKRSWMALHRFSITPDVASGQATVELHVRDDRARANQMNQGQPFDSEIAFNGTGPWRGLSAEIVFYTDLGEVRLTNVRTEYANLRPNGVTPFVTTIARDAIERWGHIYGVALVLSGSCAV